MSDMIEIPKSSVQAVRCDDRGRVTIGREFSELDVQVAVVDVLNDDVPTRLVEQLGELNGVDSAGAFADAVVTAHREARQHTSDGRVINVGRNGPLGVHAVLTGADVDDLETIEQLIEQHVAGLSVEGVDEEHGYVYAVDATPAAETEAEGQ